MFDCRYWLWLSLKFDSGSVMCDTLLQGFNQNPKSIYEADREALAPFCKNRSNILSSLLDKRLDRVYKILEFCEKTNVGIITQDSPMYPSSLMNIVGKPPVLYYKGIIPDFSKNLTIGVVGTRSVTPYGSTA
ncbi:MAG: DNA-processing protein DprA, partial [Clostridia bacterium]|nr:DNA-processing protein DprA [Clostridia bacterium]